MIFWGKSGAHYLPIPIYLYLVTIYLYLYTTVVTAFFISRDLGVGLEVASISKNFYNEQDIVGFQPILQAFYSSVN